jgi:hypothetical protein
MNRRLFSLTALLLLAACAPSSLPMRIERFLQVDGASCKSVKEAAESNGGKLDVAPGGTPRYLVGLLITGGDSFTTPAYVLTGNRPLEPADRNRPILDRLVLRYRTQASWGRDLSSVQISRTIPFDDQGMAIDTVNLISPALAELLVHNVLPGSDAELIVSVEARGYMSGDRSQISTGELNFPLLVTATDVADCPSGGPIVQPTPGACLYPGQDAISVCCDQLGQQFPGCP